MLLFSAASALSFSLIPVGHNYYLCLIFLFIFEMIDWTLLNDSTFWEFLGIFFTLMGMASLMTGFILNGLSESLLSSRLFRIKAWVLQVPFLSMIFLYFF